jgi:adenylate cyclase
MALLIGAAVFAGLLALRTAGWLRELELQAYDLLVRHASRPLPRSSEVALLEVTERDINRFGWPLSDRRLADVLRLLLDAGAAAVGVDLYRDIPVDPGRELLGEMLRREPRIVAVSKFGSQEQGGIPGPLALRDFPERVGFNDVLLDPDKTVRRGLLFQDQGGAEVESSFALRLALVALARQGISDEPDPAVPEWLRLGPATLRPFEASDGGYARADDAGYQIPLALERARAGLDIFDLAELLDGRVDAGRLRGRIVLIGANAESLYDRFRLPVARDGPSGMWPGVEVHALLVQQLLDHARGATRPLRVTSEAQELLLLLAFVALGCGLGLAGPSLGSSVGAAVPLGALALALAFLSAGAAAAWRLLGLWVPAVTPGLGGLAAVGLVTAWVSSRERAERAMLMQLFSRHLSPRLAEEVWRRRREFFSEAGRPRPVRLAATVLFVDMKGYTARAEKMDPAELMSWVNDFMGRMARLVGEHDGFVDDYFGDGIKADFGVPLPSQGEAAIDSDARRAVHCALAMGDELTRVNARYRERGFPTVAMRIGIDTGSVVAGSLGDRDRLKYTVVGDVAVTAQRLESLEGVEHDFERAPCRILVTEQTRRRLDESIATEPLGSFAVKGRQGEVAVHRVLGRAGPGIPAGAGL